MTTHYHRYVPSPLDSNFEVCANAKYDCPRPMRPVSERRPDEPISVKVVPTVLDREKRKPINYQEISRKPYEDSKPKRGKRGAEVIRLLSQKPRTSDELEQITGWPHQSVSALLNHLQHAKTIYDTGARRHTRSGYPAIVWGVR